MLFRSLSIRTLNIETCRHHSFITLTGRQRCVDPGLIWVQQIMHTIDWKRLESSSELHEHEVKTKTEPVPETFRPDPAKDPHNHETEAQPAPETMSPDPTKVGHDTKVRTQPEPKTSKPESTTVRHERETETRTRPVPETSRPDSSEPNWFCKI